MRGALVADTHSLEMLRTMYRLQPVTRAQLSESTGVSPGRSSTHVARLEAMGLVCSGASQSKGYGRPVWST